MREIKERQKGLIARVRKKRGVKKIEGVGKCRGTVKQLYECGKLLWGYKANASHITYNQLDSGLPLLHALFTFLALRIQFTPQLNK